MANNPVTRNVLKYKGSGNAQVFPNLPTMINGSQDGSDVGTGGGLGPAGLADLESPVAGNFAHNRNIEFLDDRYCLGAAAPTSTDHGVYKKAEGGAGLWGRVTGHGNANKAHGSVSGLHVLHPAGVPTLVHLFFDGGNQLRLRETVDGTTGASWGGLVAGELLETNAASPASYGQSIIFRDSIVWAHQRFTGGAGAGEVTQYDFVTQTLTRYAIPDINVSLLGSGHALHVHDNALFFLSFATSTLVSVWKLSAGAFVLIYTSQAPTQFYQDTNTAGHSAMFTDSVTGDLILVLSERNTPGFGSKVTRIQDATTSPAGSDITSTVMGSGEGADKYLAGNPSGDRIRRWSVFVDTQTTPGAPRTYLTTWSPGGATETWEWKGIGAETEAVESLQGISDDFALPYVTVGGGHRSPRTAAVEIGDASNPPVEAIGGTSYFFRAHGSAAVGVLTFRGTDSEGTPVTIVPIVAGSFSVVSGSPATTPVISGNTLTNLTPDNGVALYQITLVVDAAGVDVGEGEVALIIPEFI